MYTTAQDFKTVLNIWSLLVTESECHNCRKTCLLNQAVENPINKPFTDEKCSWAYNILFTYHHKSIKLRYTLRDWNGLPRICSKSRSPFRETSMPNQQNWRALPLKVRDEIALQGFQVYLYTNAQTDQTRCFRAILTGPATRKITPLFVINLLNTWLLYRTHSV